MITLLLTQGYLMAECWPYSCLTGTWERMDRNGDIKSSSNTVIPKWAQVRLDYNVEEKKS